MSTNLQRRLPKGLFLRKPPGTQPAITAAQHGARRTLEEIRKRKRWLKTRRKGISERGNSPNNDDVLPEPPFQVLDATPVPPCRSWTLSGKPGAANRSVVFCTRRDAGKLAISAREALCRGIPLLPAGCATAQGASMVTVVAHVTGQSHANPLVLFSKLPRAFFLAGIAAIFLAAE